MPNRVGINNTVSLCQGQGEDVLNLSTERFQDRRGKGAFLNHCMNELEVDPGAIRVGNMYGFLMIVHTPFEHGEHGSMRGRAISSIYGVSLVLAGRALNIKGYPKSLG